MKSELKSKFDIFKYFKDITPGRIADSIHKDGSLCKNLQNDHLFYSEIINNDKKTLHEKYKLYKDIQDDKCSKII